MARGFGLGRLPSGTPNIISYKYTAAQTFKKGALLVDASAGTVEEFAGGTNAVVLGVALEAVGSKPGGTGIANSPSYITGGNNNEVSVAIADRSQVFTCRGITSVLDPLTPTQTMIGEQYGVAKVVDDWVLDQDEVTTKIVEIVDIDIDQKIFSVKFLEAVLALP